MLVKSFDANRVVYQVDEKKRASNGSWMPERWGVNQSDSAMRGNIEDVYRLKNLIDPEPQTTNYEWLWTNTNHSTRTTLFLLWDNLCASQKLQSNIWMMKLMRLTNKFHNHYKLRWLISNFISYNLDCFTRDCLNTLYLEL